MFRVKYMQFLIKITEKKTVIVLANFERFHCPLFCHGIEAHRVSAIELRVNKEVGASILFYCAGVRNSKYTLIFFLSPLCMYDYFLFPGSSRTVVANFRDLKLKL